MSTRIFCYVYATRVRPCFSCTITVACSTGKYLKFGWPGFCCSQMYFARKQGNTPNQSRHTVEVVVRSVKGCKPMQYRWEWNMCPTFKTKDIDLIFTEPRIQGGSISLSLRSSKIEPSVLSLLFGYCDNCSVDNAIDSPRVHTLNEAVSVKVCTSAKLFMVVWSRGSA